jgi:hypothetical protein
MLEFIFTNFWTFSGTLLLLHCFFNGVYNCLELIITAFKK